MPIDPKPVARNWEDSVMRKLGDFARRLTAVERRGPGRQRQIFMFFAQDSTIPFVWQAQRHNMVITAATLTGTGAVTYTHNGTSATLPINVVPGDVVKVTATGTDVNGLAVTLTEDYPFYQ